jgi:hypothetical protein
MRIGIVVPTIPGREESLDRTIESYKKMTRGPELVWFIHEDSPSCGIGWRNGANALELGYGPLDYLHFTNDDIEVTDPKWWKVCTETADEGGLPCPVVMNPNGSLQSAGGQLGQADDLLRDLVPDKTAVDFTTVPFMSWEQWKAIGMLPIHYSADVWVSYRGRQLGYETFLRLRYRLTHHTHPVGRGPQLQRGAEDQAMMFRELELR